MITLDFKDQAPHLADLAKEEMFVTTINDTMTLNFISAKSIRYAVNGVQQFENGLELAFSDSEVAFFWIEKEKSWLGLWEGTEYQTPYHPSLRHIAFRVTYEQIKVSLDWMQEKGITPKPFGRRDSVDSFVRPYQGNASVYFDDPDGTSLELMCFVHVPEHLRSVNKMLSMEEWEELLAQ